MGVVLIITAPVWALLGLLVHLCVDKPRDRRFQKAFDKTDLGNWVAATSWVDMKNKVSQHWGNLLKWQKSDIITSLYIAQHP